MQKCVKCKEKLSYGKLLSSTWSLSGYKDIQCKSCNTRLKISALSKVILTIFMVMPFVLLLLNPKYMLKLSGNYWLYYMAYLVVIITSSPLIVRYKPIE